MASTAYEQDADGSRIIPATQRPDGTWRKPRRVRDGYVPQEEVPLYESKGKQFKAKQNTGLPVGMPPEIAAEGQKKKKPTTIQPIPGMIINVEKKKKKKKTVSAVEESTEKLAKCEVKEDLSSNPSSCSISSNSVTADPTKRLKNLRKKLRDIETLEEKIKIGIVKNPDKDQMEKLSKIGDIIREIELLEIHNS